MAQVPLPKFSFGGNRKQAEPGVSLEDIFDDFVFPNNAIGNFSADDDDEGDDDSDDADEFGEADGRKKRKRVRISQKNMSEEQKIERR